MNKLENELVDEVDSEFYKLIYIKKDYKKAQESWDKYKNDELFLQIASTVIRDKFDERNIFVGNVIVELILKFPEDVNRGIYEEVVDKIYEDNDLAKIIVGGYYNNNLPFLLYTLTNKNLKLSESQKNKVYNLALNQYFTDKTKEYGGIYCLSARNSCGVFPYDIRYWILNNNNWTEEEKEQMIYQFYSKEELYVKFLDCLEFDIQGMYDLVGVNIPKDVISYMKDFEIEKLINDEEIRREVTEETHFVKSLKRLRRPKLLSESL